MSKQQEPEPNPTARVGDTVKVHYTCKLDNGEVFATTNGKDPIEFVIGNAKIVPGLQDAVIGMETGQTKSVTIPPDRAYGPYHDEMTAVLDRSMVPADLELEVGLAIRVKHADGHESDVFITAIEGDKISVDGNHPLAGKNLYMEIELVGLVREP